LKGGAWLTHRESRRTQKYRRFEKFGITAKQEQEYQCRKKSHDINEINKNMRQAIKKRGNCCECAKTEKQTTGLHDNEPVIQNHEEKKNLKI
jgi:hypothetical protein